MTVRDSHSFDAIVVGTGISGGWAAKELTEKGLKTLVLDRGRMIKHGEYPTATKELWELPYGDRPTQRDLERQPVTRRAGYLTQAAKHWFVDDVENPYTEVKEFVWARGYHVGGRSITWGRHSYRWSPMDFEANGLDGIGVDWPIRYGDIEPWYDYVERFIGVSGQAEGLAQLPDGQFLPPMELNCVERHFKQSMAEKFGRTVTIGRVANLTALLPHSPQRGKCQSRNLCIRGCPYGAYFSSNASTLPAAEATGNMTLRPNSIVYELVYDESKGRVTGVRVLDADTNQQLEFHAKVIFLCASTFGSTFILLNSISSRFPIGLGNDSGELGCNVMDHHAGIGATALVEGFDRQYYSGKRPNCFYMPRFANVGKDKRDYLRGFHCAGEATPVASLRRITDSTLGADLKTNAAAPGPWLMFLGAGGETNAAAPGPWLMFLGAAGEMLPNHENRITIDRTRKDRYGLPVLAFDVQLRDNEMKMRRDMAAEVAAMLDAAGYTDVRAIDQKYTMGAVIHEMGTARMGRNPNTSVLNEWNQVHACKNVYVTDGSCMTSSACQNPSLTYMALTARAANHAVEELKRMNL